MLILLFRTAVCFCHSDLQVNLPLPCFHPGKLSEMKSTWSPGPISHGQASLSHELWKVPQGPRSSTTAPSRPPPGLTNTKPSSTWGGNSLGLAQGWSSSYTSGMSRCERFVCFPTVYLFLPAAVLSAADGTELIMRTGSLLFLKMQTKIIGLTD